MNDFLKGWGNPWLEFLICIALASASVLTIEALAAQHADAVTVHLQSQTTLKPLSPIV